MGLTLDYKKLDELLKYMKYIRISHSYYYPIEGYYSFGDTNFRYRRDKSTELVSINSRDFFIGSNYNSNWLYNNKIAGKYLSYEFYSVVQIEIPKIFETPKDILNTLSSYQENARILDYRLNKHAPEMKIVWGSNAILKNVKTFNAWDAANNVQEEINIVAIWAGQENVNTQYNYINLDNGGYIAFSELIPIDIRKAII
jgi:hypothetical protein